MPGRFAIALAAAILSTLVGTAPAQPARPLEQNLLETNASERGARVSDVRYELSFRLSAALPEYSGEVTADFELSSVDHDLTLDFAAGTIYSIAVNDREAPLDYNDYFVTLPAGLLQKGRNTVAISFSHPYSSDGSGLYRFRDPEDGRTYLYTDFEPFNQNRLFPSFDQPDLKARYMTTVRAPATWQVIANTREDSIEAADDERVWHFPETLPLSTYVYAMHAGDYHVWESAAGDIPLRLFAREALVPYVYPEDWFVPTRQGFGFYQSYFETPYPFGKYDQVIVPHFNAGAMENVGAVTFSERYLSRGTVTRQNRRAIASVILHEMAHMWFGDLVTMAWWNGLWLNESFATVMAVLAMTEATEFDDEWQESYRDTIRAYQADERDTTHPIELQVPDTNSAFANFDRITYEKGSATLVQLMHLVGPENFRRGVAHYLATYAYGNTRIDDFLDAISTAADIDLDQWAHDWLLEPGTNTVEVELACDAERISNLTLVQGAPAQWPTLRTHRAQVGLYRFASGTTHVDTIPVTYSGARTDVPEAAGLACPDLAYANHGDWDYIRVRLDTDAVAMLDGRLNRLDDPLGRLMLWQSVWDTVLDARMPVTEFLTFALDNLDNETNEAAIRQVLGAISSAAGYLDEILEQGPTRAELQGRLENYLWRSVTAAGPGSDLQLLYYDVYVTIASSDAAMERLAALHDGRLSPPPGLTIDQDRRWSLLTRLAANGYTGVAAMIEVEQDRDPSDEGLRRTQTAAAARPDPDWKTMLIGELLDPAVTPNLAEFRAIAGGLFPRGQHRLQLASTEVALDGLATLNSTRDPAFYSAYVGGLLGSNCDRRYLELLNDAIESGTGLHPLIQRTLRDSRFETGRCLAIATRLRESL